MSMNVFKYAFRPRYYLTHPIEFLKETKGNIIAAWLRATRGYCYSDIWNWNTWFLEIMPPMLRHMADYGVAYPGHEPFDTPEKWNDWLHSVADVLESLQEENWDTKNEFAEDFHRLCERNRIKTIDENNNLCITFSDDAELEEISELFVMRQKELNEEWNKLAEDTLKCIGQHFSDIWD